MRCCAVAVSYAAGLRRTSNMLEWISGERQKRESERLRETEKSQCTRCCVINFNNMDAHLKCMVSSLTLFLNPLRRIESKSV